MPSAIRRAVHDYELGDSLIANISETNTKDKRYRKPLGGRIGVGFMPYPALPMPYPILEAEARPGARKLLTKTESTI